ncbi:hypothetical protein A3C09_01480 [Candidatus Uhrbacteria bacterium RIFCSPHIGHO2_02_FULL_47_44]|uniref:Gcp-like domain-containing protein n=1 Tax=Candidatus Uhrbacteria bacterium RIFCSPLOWO2_02_FULL_48_18 TaxID=1802408 RepID=A0A1F7V900_9BACT|nr:MAG: hypothetical protein A2839_02360 [Candidatus Uhrbacteria bacterium RIFCSPHIGHO2_01_FULL_47_10]OGL69836.1 MAG: hypothetical protein A3C09_01480 [Candidatus Uhrbacteria bacterium RIFCSPHIGHO2_02_FULL_47_44]OGL77456.1 MAG: hypothetical protein A3E97_00540 [Candidatus Uhrbacteria bacterium RIFCSPHIGHO2_12_FULL_47_12]OGL81817.1 MAG: hypothetical protein A3B20_01845 [Candidatus Uhrbacteria bacterium RIFCSPLOWO2_01_FULL_47_17]OGL86980.1 MAG: hypothetical protein A3I41_03435 [Candidatus Uhrbact
MDLFLCAQDIQFITFGLVSHPTPTLPSGRGGGLRIEKTFEVPPEKYLASFDAFLREQQVLPEHISRLLVVNGPGSFTASRVSVVIANTFAFVRKIPVIPVENPDRLPIEKLLPILQTLPEHIFVTPAYDRPPNIT